MRKQCNDCWFWVSNDAGDIFHPESGDGRCHRYAPSKANDDRHEWPPTMKDDWCGDYKGRMQQTLIEQREVNA